MKDNLPNKPDVIIIDRDIKSKIKLVPSMFSRHNDSRPTIAIINQKPEDIFDIQSGEFTDSIKGIDQ